MKSELPAVGKISPEIFEQLIFPRLGAAQKSILVGPQHGVDVGVVDLGHGQVMVLTTDPFFVVPQYGWDRAAWFAVHILASDAATSGLRPKYLSVDLNLPRSIQKEELELLWTAVDRECRKLDIAIVTGHTARYDGCNYPMVGGATMISVGSKTDYVTPRMAQEGDVIILTKGAAIEAAGIFAVTFGPQIARQFGEPFARQAEEIFWQMSVVEDAMTAVSVGVHEEGVTAMHDATECGVWGGLYEVAQASEVGMVVEKANIPVLDEVDKICSHFGMDPYSSISEGTLIITCRPHRAEDVLQALGEKDILAAIIGEVTSPDKGIQVIDDGQQRPLAHPRVDPFWEAFGKALEEMGG
ncbi:AIR synthase family protein [Candidatus Zixiibacteriota bacterium]